MVRSGSIKAPCRSHAAVCRAAAFSRLPSRPRAVPGMETGCSRRRSRVCITQPRARSARKQPGSHEQRESFDSQRADMASVRHRPPSAQQNRQPHASAATPSTVHDTHCRGVMVVVYAQDRRAPTGKTA